MSTQKSRICRLIFKGRLGITLTSLVLFIGLSLSVPLFSGLLRAGSPLIADLESHSVSISIGFSGSEVLLFGAIEEEEGDEESDILIVVEGPKENILVRKKERILGVWANDKTIHFEGVPSFYAIASTKPADQILNELNQRLKRTTMESLADTLKERIVGTRLSENKALEWAQALVRSKQRQNLYQPNNGRVSFVGGGRQLFKATLDFPSNVPTKGYDVKVHRVVDGRVVNSYTVPMHVSKTGFGADVYNFANRYPAIYGIICILLALVAGYTSSAIFRR